MKSKHAVLLVDGWKNKTINTKNLVALIRLDNKQYVFLGSWDFSDKSETGEELTKTVNICVQLALEQYAIKIYVVVTDNAANMMKMGRTVDLWYLTCSSHSGNLLCKALVDNKFGGEVKSVINEFKNPFLQKKLVDKSQKKLISIGETRWCSHRDAFKRVLEVLESIREISREHRTYFSEESYKLINSTKFSAALLDNTLLMDPVCEFINTSQQADCSVAESTQKWLTLEIPAAITEYEKKLEQRVEKAINVYGLVANFLHPVYQGSLIMTNPDYNREVTDFFEQNLDEDGLKELEEYKKKTGCFAKLFVKNYQETLFWTVAQSFYPHLSEIALKLMNIPASTAQLERFFSHWAYVHDPKRNRLTPERSYKLAALYYHLRPKDKKILVEDDDDEVPWLANHFL